MSEENESSTIRIKKTDLWKYTTIVLAIVVVVAGFVMFTGDSGTTGNVANQPANERPTQPSQVQVDADDDAVLGDKDAPVTIIEFSDYECPFCARFWSQTLPSIKENYIDTGKVNFVYRDFPLTSIHSNAQAAAEAAECVGEQGGDSAYYEMHDKIFANQQSLSKNNLINWADELGYDIENCLNSGEMRSEVQNDLKDVTSAGGRGTPYFVIIDEDGRTTTLSGAQPFSVFEQAVESMIA